MTVKSQPLQRTLLGSAVARWQKGSVGWVYRTLHRKEEVRVRNRVHGQQVLRYPPTTDKSVGVSPKRDGPNFRTNAREDPPQNALIVCGLSSLCGNDVYVYGPLPQGTLPHPGFLETPPGRKGMGHSPLFTRQEIHSAQWRPPIWVSMMILLGSQLGCASNKEACYVVGYMSGSGFGSSTWKSKERKIHAEFGAWSEKVSNESSSNFREAVNLVESLKRKVGSGTISQGLKVFVFTDKFVAESTMYKGSSSSKLLHNMILNLWKMTMNSDIIIRFVRISGNPMIWQGTDILSRGDFTSGVMAGEAFLKFILLHLSAFD
eukprot:jgi/Psemu1/28460/gm1.28460_g